MIFLGVLYYSEYFDTNISNFFYEHIDSTVRKQKTLGCYIGIKTISIRKIGDYVLPLCSLLLSLILDERSIGI